MIKSINNKFNITNHVIKYATNTNLGIPDKSINNLLV